MEWKEGKRNDVRGDNAKLKIKERAGPFVRALPPLWPSRTTSGSMTSMKFT